LKYVSLCLLCVCNRILKVGESIYIVTSHVVPLSSKLEEYKGQEQMLTWGLHQLLVLFFFSFCFFFFLAFFCVGPLTIL